MRRVKMGSRIPSVCGYFFITWKIWSNNRFTSFASWLLMSCDATSTSAKVAPGPNARCTLTVLPFRSHQDKHQDKRQDKQERLQIVPLTLSANHEPQDVGFNNMLAKSSDMTLNSKT